MPSPSAIYSHLSAPIVTGVYTSNVSLHIIFDGAGSDVNDPGLTFDVYRDPEAGESEIERVHAGCIAQVVNIAGRRGVALDPANVEYGGA